jgi:hypothetical protein
MADTLRGVTPQDDTYFFLSTKEIIVARHRSLADRLAYFNDNDLHQQALELAVVNKDRLGEELVDTTRSTYLNWLLQKGMILRALISS